MATRIRLEFRESDYSGYTGNLRPPPRLTEMEAAICLSALSLLLIREAWEPMSDADWDMLEEELSIIIDAFLR